MHKVFIPDRRDLLQLMSFWNIFQKPRSRIDNDHDPNLQSYTSLNFQQSKLESSLYYLNVLKAGSSNCTSCPAGKYATAEGANSSQACSWCESGVFAAVEAVDCSPLCDVGTYYKGGGSSECIACGAGEYSTASGANSSASCKQCEAGTFSSSAG